MQEPWTWVVSDPTNGYVITVYPERDDITLRRVDVVIPGLPCASNNTEMMLQGRS
jgi:hypothetical protein